MNEFLALSAAVLSLFTLIGLGVLIARKTAVNREALNLLTEELRSQPSRNEAVFRNEFNLFESRSGSQRQELYQWLAGNLESRFDRLIGTSGEQFSGLGNTLKSSFELQNQRFDSFANQLRDLTKSNEQKLEALRATVDARLDSLQQDNNAKLERMRQTVEEKLQTTLESRLSESFKTVSVQLQAVHTAMGDMQNLAKQVGSIKTLMSNVKDRGGWGEFQLAAILQQFLHASQYEANVCTKPGSSERVEFAIKLPGQDKMDSPVWLPVDAKFPKEDYERLASAIQNGDLEAEKASRADLLKRLKACARDIRDKYLNPPNTTDFGIMFLPTEGLYAEALREPGLADGVQRDCRVVIAGPSTLVALLNSLQMGFRTLAIQQRSSEVWEILGSVKTEFEKFGDWLAKVKDKFNAASKELERVDTRTRIMRSKLKNVDAAPAGVAEKHLGSGENDLGETPEPDEVPQS